MVEKIANGGGLQGNAANLGRQGNAVFNAMQPLETGNLIARSKKILGSIDFEMLSREGLVRGRDYRLLCSRPTQAETGGEPNTMQEASIGPKSPTIADIAQSAKDGYNGVLYVHIPFCETICTFCPYDAISKGDEHNYSKNNSGESIRRQYLKALGKELGMWKSAYGSLNIRQLYIGGGTPSSLGADEIRRLFGMLRAHCEFEEGAEITFEISPASLRKGMDEKLAALKECGVNRISMGVQSFDKGVLKAIARSNSGEELARSVFGALRGFGFDNINIDLIYGLPGQTLEIFESDLKKVAGLGPESITTYHLRIEEDTEFMELYKRQPELFPQSNPTMLTMKIMATEYLAELGYSQSPTDWFYKGLGKHVAQHEKWQNGSELLGIGVSAYSTMEKSGWYFGNIGSIKDRAGSMREYITRVNEGRDAIGQGRLLAKEEQMESYARRAIKTGICRQFFRERYGKDVLDAFPQIAHLEELGIVEVDGESVRLTYVGNLVAEEAAAKL